MTHTAIRLVRVVNQFGVTEEVNELLLKSTTFNMLMLLRSGSDPVSWLFAKFLHKMALSETR
jgi:hypothetical protein